MLYVRCGPNLLRAVKERSKYLKNRTVEDYAKSIVHLHWAWQGFAIPLKQGYQHVGVSLPDDTLVSS